MAERSPAQVQSFHQRQMDESSKKTISKASILQRVNLSLDSEASEQEVDQAVKAAKKAFESWSGLDPHQRSRFLYAMARQMQKHARLLAVLETLDNGRPSGKPVISMFHLR